MTRIIVVIDVELEKENWPLRTKVYERCLKILMAGEKLPENVTIRQTHMKGFRVLLEDKTQIENFLEKTAGYPKDMDAILGNLHSESNYASIFFVDWPIDKMTSLP